MGFLDIFKKKKWVRSTDTPPSLAAAENSSPAAAAKAAAGGAAEPASSSAAPPASPAPASPAAAAPAAAAPAAEAASSTKGGYLTFDAASNGTLFLVWSYTPVEGALAFFRPHRNVAEFKFKDNGGKTEIFRNLMQDKSKYYEGFCQFFKAAAEQRGDCMLLPGVQTAPLKVEVAFLDGCRVLLLQQNSSINAGNKTAVGCIPKGDNAFQSQTLAKEVFLRNARRGGAAITL